MKKRYYYFFGGLLLFLFMMNLLISDRAQAACDCWKDVVIIDCAVTFYGGSEQGCYEVQYEECEGECLSTIGCTQSGQTSLSLINPSATGIMPDNVLSGGCGWKINNLTCSWGEKTANPFDPPLLMCRCSGDVTEDPCDRVTSYKDCPE